METRVIATRLAEAYGVPLETVSRAVDSLVEELVENCLVVQHDGTGDAPSPGHQKPVVGPFEFPRLEKYSDMADLILLDPVHDVDALGWPHEDTRLQDQ